MSQIKERIATAFLHFACSMDKEDESQDYLESTVASRGVAATEFAAALIAGGSSRRMGVDKALLTVTWRGRQMPLWRRQLAVLKELEPSQLLLSGPQRPGSPVIAIADRWTTSGPLAGIATCLEFVSYEFLLVLAVDLPRIESACLRLLLLHSANGCGVVPVREGRYEPLTALYPKRALDFAVARLGLAELKLQEFVQELVSVGLVRPWAVPVQMDEQFANWNSPTDIA
jgi:molybdopterin-guanine dinucleotide biosynthesis protein A